MARLTLPPGPAELPGPPTPPGMWVLAIGTIFPTMAHRARSLCICACVCQAHVGVCTGPPPSLRGSSDSTVLCRTPARGDPLSACPRVAHPSPVAAFPCLHGLLRFCVVCRVPRVPAPPCTATENGCTASRGGGGPSRAPRPLPAHSPTPDPDITCSVEVVNKPKGFRDWARAWTPPPPTLAAGPHPHFSHVRGCCRVHEPRLGAFPAAPTTADPAPSRPDSPLGTTSHSLPRLEGTRAPPDTHLHVPFPASPGRAQGSGGRQQPPPHPPQQPPSPCRCRPLTPSLCDMGTVPTPGTADETHKSNLRRH